VRTAIQKDRIVRLPVRMCVYDGNVCVCARVCVTRTIPATRKTARYCVYMHIYRGVSLRTLPCTLTRRRFPIFRPETLDRKAPAFGSRRSSAPRVVIPFLSATARSARLLARQRHSCATSEPSYSDKIERILAKRLRLRRPTPPSSPRTAPRCRRSRNIYYKP